MRNEIAAAYPARVVGNSLSPSVAPVMVIAVTWMVSAWVSAPATTPVDSVKMMVSLLTSVRWAHRPGRADKTLVRNGQAPD